MKTTEKKRLLFFISICIVSFVFAERQYIKFSHGKVMFPAQQLTVKVEVATTTVQRTLGLMHRKFLPKNEGMLFVFEQKAILKIWMKNTLIPLDVIFISELGEIVSMIKDLQPCMQKTCNIYNSTKKAKYMLEINKGMIEKNKIIVGQQLILFLG